MRVFWRALLVSILIVCLFFPSCSKTVTTRNDTLVEEEKKPNLYNNDPERYNGIKGPNNPMKTVRTHLRKCEQERKHLVYNEEAEYKRGLLVLTGKLECTNTVQEISQQNEQ